MTDASGGAPSFEGAIKPLFRERDQSSMLQVFDLWSYDDVKANSRLDSRRCSHGLYALRWAMAR